MKKEAAMGRKRKPEDQIGSTDARGGGPTAERIRQRAHEIYERRQALGLPGDAEGDWLQAEAELGPQAVPKP